MNVNDVAAAWKAAQAGVEPKWNEDAHTQVTVDIAKRFHNEVKILDGIDRGNENGNGRTEG